MMVKNKIYPVLLLAIFSSIILFIYYECAGSKSNLFALNVASIEKDAMAGDSNSQMRMGDAYRLGLGVEYSQDKMMLWYKKAAKNGSWVASQRLGDIYFYGTNGIRVNYTEACDWYEIPAQKGSSTAQTTLGVAYLTGEGRVKDTNKAFYWLSLAAKQGNHVAEYHLGYMYLYGIGIAQDYQQAQMWLKKSADQSDPMAKMALASIYEYGLGTEKNSELATNYLREAAVSVPEAQYNLAQKEMNTVPLTSELALSAASNLEGASKRGVSYAAILLDKYRSECLKSDSLNQNSVYSCLAATGGNDPQIEYVVGTLFKKGFFAKQDNEAAFNWFLKSAMKGYVPSQLFVEISYSKGEGVDKDVVQALAWHQVIAQMPNYLQKLPAIDSQEKFQVIENSLRSELSFAEELRAKKIAGAILSNIR